MTTNHQENVQLATQVTFYQALRDKYVDQEEFDDRLTLPKDKSIGTEIVLVGFGTVTSVQKQLNRLTGIDLSGMNIGSAGKIGELKGSLNRLRILDIANNCLTWQGITSIASCLPNLRELIISENKLSVEDFTPPASLLEPLFCLTVGRVFLDWNTIVRILSQTWRRVEQLDLWDNHLTCDSMKLISPEELDLSLVKQIRSLKLSHNNFPNINWISKIGPVEGLIEFDLSKCQLQSFEINPTMAMQLSSLQVLNISYNNLNNWRSISSLHHLKNLRSLICHENPFFITEKFAKPLTIGRLAGLKTLNREEVTRNSRRDSEVLYWRRTFLEYKSFINGENADFKLDHPRYEDLVSEYGLPEDLNKAQIVDKYVSVNLCFEQVKIIKKLPCYMRIANVHMLCKRLFKLKLSTPIKITCYDIESTRSYVLDKDDQTLHFFSVKDGHKLVVEQLNQ